MGVQPVVNLKISAVGNLFVSTRQAALLRVHVGLANEFFSL